MSQLNSRLQTGNLNLTGLNTSQVMVDSYVHPRSPSNTGSDLMQLGQALSTLSPGLSEIMGRTDAYQKQQQDLQDAAHGSQVREQFQDPMAARKYLADNRNKMSPEWINAYEESDAQITANQYPAALQQKLEAAGLWNNEKADPKDVAGAMAQVRSQFLSSAEGTGPAWQKVFSQRSSAFENGVMNQWLERVSHLREDHAEQSALDDMTAQFLSHQQLPTVDEVAKSFSQYTDHSYLTIPADRLNQLKVKAVVNAHSIALNNGNTELAQRVLAAFSQLPTNQNGKLAETSYAGQALEQMHQAEYYHTRDSKYEQTAAREQLKEDYVSQMMTLKEKYRGLPPSQIPTVLPDSALRQKMDSLGIDSDSEWQRFRNINLQADKQGETDSNDAALNTVFKLQSQLRLNETKDGLQSIGDQIHKMDDDPQFNSAVPREHLNQLISEWQGQKKRYDDTGKLGSVVYRSSESEVKSLGRQIAAQSAEILTKYKKDMTSPFFQRFHLEAQDDGTGQLHWGFSDLNQQMLDDFSKEADAASDGKPWDLIPRDTLRKAGQHVTEKYKPLFEQRVQQIEQSLKDEKKQQDDARAKAQDVPATVSTTSGRPIEVKGPSGLLTHDALANVQSAATVANWVSGYSQDAPNNTVGMVGPSTSDVDHILTVLNRETPRTGMTDVSNQSSSARARSLINTAHTPDGPAKPRRTGLAGFLAPSPLGADEGGWEVQMQAPLAKLQTDLNGLEGNKALMDAVNHTATSQKLDPYEPVLQQVYRRKRQDYLRLAQSVGFPTDLSISDKPSFKPEWVDWGTTPMFSKMSDITDDNVKKLMKNLGMNPEDQSQFYSVKGAQLENVRNLLATYRLQER